MKGRLDKIANLFRAEVTPGPNFGEEVYPGYPGLVVVEGVAGPMAWGFPLRLKTMKPTSKPKAVNNARDDKLMSGMWRDSFTKPRCLIPVTQWARPKGPQAGLAGGKGAAPWGRLGDMRADQSPCLPADVQS